VPRTLIKTAAAGWYIDADNPDGHRVRKRDEDEVVTRDEFDVRRNGHAKANDAPAKPTPSEGQNVTVADTGKLLIGKTTAIRCKWVPEDQQTPAVQKLYEKDQRQVTLEQVQKAAAGVAPCGRERTVKVQDAFQAKFCVQHQDENRKAIRRNKARAKRKARK
jgi:hypothetical protein